MSSTPKRNKEQEQTLFEKLDNAEENDFGLSNNFENLQNNPMFLDNEKLFKFLNSYHKACEVYGKEFIDNYLQRDIFVNY